MIYSHVPLFWRTALPRMTSASVQSGYSGRLSIEHPQGWPSGKCTKDLRCDATSPFTSVKANPDTSSKICDLFCPWITFGLMLVVVSPPNLLLPFKSRIPNALTAPQQVSYSGSRAMLSDWSTFGSRWQSRLLENISRCHIQSDTHIVGVSSGVVRNCRGSPHQRESHLRRHLTSHRVHHRCPYVWHRPDHHRHWTNWQISESAIRKRWQHHLVPPPSEARRRWRKRIVPASTTHG